MPNDPNDPLPSPLPAVIGQAPREEPDPPSRGRVTCEGCGCSLDTGGRIIRRGDGLKAHLDREDEVTRLQKELDSAHDSVRLLETELSTLKSKARKSIIF